MGTSSKPRVKNGDRRLILACGMFKTSNSHSDIVPFIIFSNTRIKMGKKYRLSVFSYFCSVNIYNSS